MPLFCHKCQQNLANRTINIPEKAGLGSQGNLAHWVSEDEGYIAIGGYNTKLWIISLGNWVSTEIASIAGPAQWSGNGAQLYYLYDAYGNDDYDFMRYDMATESSQLLISHQDFERNNLRPTGNFLISSNGDEAFFNTDSFWSIKFRR